MLYEALYFGVWSVFFILVYYDVFYFSWAQHGKQGEKWKW